MIKKIYDINLKNEDLSEIFLSNRNFNILKQIFDIKLETLNKNINKNKVKFEYYETNNIIAKKQIYNINIIQFHYIYNKNI